MESIIGLGVKWWAGLDKMENRGRIIGHSVLGHADSVRQGDFIASHFNILHEVANESLPLWDCLSDEELRRMQGVSLGALAR